MLNNKNLKLISIIKKYINNDPKLYVKFNHYNRKYPIDELMPYIIEILEDGISFRKIKSSISWSTIYKFHQKLVQFKIIENTYDLNVNKYLSNLETLPQNYYTDTTFVCNKLGEESVGYNQQIKKHKTSKISIITDDFNIPVSVSISSGSPHDSTILYNQLDDLHNKHPLLFNKNKTLIADAAYDSQKLRVKVEELNLGKLLTHKNRRNTYIYIYTYYCNGKQKEIKDIYKIDEYLLLKQRINVEHSICEYKKYKRCQLRYDRQLNTFSSFVYLASLKILIKKVGFYII